MNFASWAFAGLFLPATLLLFWSIRGAEAAKWRQWLLILASVFFYLWSGLFDFGVLIGSVCVNFGIGKALTLDRWSKRARKGLMWSAVFLNLALLLAFKIAAVQTQSGTGFSSSQAIFIPLALSFITFQQIGFVTACYRKQITRVTPARYLFFVTFFPQLIMGPIVRFEDINGQLDRGALARAVPADVAVGLAIFTFGLAKKLLIADPLSAPVDMIFAFGQHGPLSMREAWFAIAGFQLQLFFDFTAYGDMAIGLGRMFGMNMPINFDRPLFATNRFDLWRRWHISFVMFMRTNVFLPLVRHARFPVILALATTGVLSGLWHGLGMTFIVWGLIQTMLLLTVHFRNTRKRRATSPGRLHHGWLIASTFLVTCLVGAMFRAPTLDAAAHIYGGLVGLGASVPAQASPNDFAMLALAAGIAWGLPDTMQLFRKHWTAFDMRHDGKPAPVHWLERYFGFRLTPGWGLAIATLLAFALIRSGEAQRFIYVQF